MPCGKSTGAKQRQIVAYSTTVAYEWFTDWMPCVGMDSMRAVMKIKASSNAYFQGQICIQVASVRTDEPDQPILKDSQRTGNGEWCTGNLDISADTDDKMFIRFGVAYNYQSAQSQSSSTVELEVTYQQCGEIVAAATHQLTTMTTDAQYIAITGWLPAHFVDKVKAAVVCNGLTGNFRWRLAYRTAGTSKDSPNAWGNVTDANAPYQSGETNTNDLAITNTGIMWVQIGIAYFLSTGSTLGQATVAAAIGVRRT